MVKRSFMGIVGGAEVNSNLERQKSKADCQVQLIDAWPARSGLKCGLAGKSKPLEMVPILL